MKTFVRPSTLKLLSLCMLFFTAIAFTSCGKNDKEDNKKGEAKVTVINAAEGSSAQNLYLDNNKLNGSAIAYLGSTSSLTTGAGTRKAEFRSEGSATVNAAFDLNLQANKYYSVYFAGTTAAPTYLVTEDDISAPPAGKAKIRVVNLASAFDTAIDVRVEGAGPIIINNLGYKSASDYVVVDGGTIFEVFPATIGVLIFRLPTAVDAGKSYTVYVTGATAESIDYRIIIRS